VCAEGYTAFACGVCAAGYYRIGQECRECPDTSPLLWVVAIGAFVLLFGAVLAATATAAGTVVSVVQGQAVQLFAVFTIFLNFAQVRLFV
jgi:hypothetical protein